MNRTKDEIGERVLERILELWGPRRDDRLTQEEIAHRSGYRQQEISLLLKRAKPVVPLTMLDRVLRVFGTTLVAVLQSEMGGAVKPLGKASSRRAELLQLVKEADETELLTLLDAARTFGRLRKAKANGTR